MSKSDLRSQLHDPDYWLGPPEPPWYSAISWVGYLIASAFLVLLCVVGLGITVWLLPGWAVLVSLWIGWQLAQRP